MLTAMTNNLQAALYAAAFGDNGGEMAFAQSQVAETVVPIKM